MNPIEQVFAKLKHFLRKAAARSVETICAAIGEILGAFTPDECAKYFQNSGYVCTNPMHHALDLRRALLKSEQLNEKMAQNPSLECNSFRKTLKE